MPYGVYCTYIPLLVCTPVPDTGAQPLWDNDVYTSREAFHVARFKTIGQCEGLYMVKRASVLSLTTFFYVFAHKYTPYSFCSEAWQATQIMESSNNAEWALQSKVIDFLRFPMALMVIFIHQSRQYVDSPATFGEYLYNILGHSLSQVLPSIAVPMFFFFSGYLYFYKVKEWNKEAYFARTKKRFHSLIIPYFSWNLLSFIYKLAAIVCAVFITGNRTMDFLVSYIKDVSCHIFWDSSRWDGGFRCFGLLEASEMTGPHDLPLWFLRNLIILVLITPVIHYLAKRLGKFFIILGIAYISNTWIEYPPLRISGIFWFSFGCYLSINNLTIISRFKKVRNVAYIIAIISALICIDLSLTGHNQLLSAIAPIYIICGVISAYCIMHHLVKTGKHTRQWAVLAQSSFFVYAIHSICVNHIVQKIIHRTADHLFAFCPIAGNIVGYLIAPFVVAATCVLIYMAIKRFTPKLLVLFTGGR